MKDINKALIDWAIQTIEKEYPEDVAILVGRKGACKIPTDSQDVAFDFFIPATDRGYNFARTFIIDEMGYDLFPMSWERVEGIAQFNESLTSVLADGEILYARTKEEAKRFLKLQEVLKSNLQDENLVFNKALEKVGAAKTLFEKLILEDALSYVRKNAGGILNYLTEAIALVNGTYLKQGPENQISALKEMAKCPEGYIAAYMQIITAKNVVEVKKACYEILKMTQQFFCSLNQRAEEKDYNFADLATWYEEGRYTWRRIDYYCKQKDAVNSFAWGCYLQVEFDIIKEEFGLETMDLLGTFDAADLSTYAKRAEEIEKYIVSEIAKHQVKINKYKDLDEFLNAQG